MVESANSSNALTIKTSENKPYPFLSDEMRSKNRQSAFLTEDKLPADRPSPFLQREDSEKDAQSKLTVQREENAQKSNAVKSLNTPKDTGTILTELRRDTSHQNVSIRDIAAKYGISYIQAQNIYVALHKDSNGIVKELNIPRNSTVSYLV